MTSQTEELLCLTEKAKILVHNVKDKNDTPGEALKTRESWQIMAMPKTAPQMAKNDTISKYRHRFALSSDDCGKPVEPAIRTKVVGGKKADKGVWPWMAQLSHRQENDTRKHLCGGVLISETHVLTAAHCFEKFG